MNYPSTWNHICTVTSWKIYRSCMLDIHRMWIYLITLYSLIPSFVLPETTCTPEDTKVRKTPFWTLRIFDDYKYIYGFPPDFIGGSVATVSIKNRTCEPSNEQHKKSRECIQAFVPTYCHFNNSQLDKLVWNVGQGTRCPTQYIPEFHDSDRKEFFPVQAMEISDPIHGTFGQMDEDREKKLEAFFVQCATDCSRLISIGGIYLCEYETFLSIINGNSIESDIITWDMTQKKIFQLYIYWFCRVTLPLLQEQFPDNVDIKAHPFCPNPCSIRSKKCSMVENSLTPVHSSGALYAFSQSNCVRTGWGFYQMEYQCLCQPGHTWNPFSKTCAVPDLCAASMSNKPMTKEEEAKLPCSRIGTLRCISMPAEQRGLTSEELFLYNRQLKSKPHCVCRPGYMGYRCERRMDACIQSPSPGQVPGEQACREFLGNKCQAVNGTNQYFCHCAESWSPDPMYPYPNCFKRKSICDRIICRNRGICVGSPDQTTFGCLCEYGWTGALCEIPDVRQWLPWSAWTICSAPLCGGMGWHSRTRECRVPVNATTGYGQCTGNTVEYRPCKSGCIDPLRSYVPMIKLVVMFAACLLLLQLAVSIIYALLYMNFV